MVGGGGEPRERQTIGCSPASVVYSRTFVETADQIIARLANSPLAQEKPGDRETVLSRIKVAPFSSRAQAAKDWQKAGGRGIIGQPYPGDPSILIESGTLLDSLTFHVAKRIAQGKWQPQSTPEQYLADLRAAVAHPEVQLWTGFDDSSGGPVAGTLTPTHRGSVAFTSLAKPKFPSCIFVIYDATRGHIRSGYLVREEQGPKIVGEWRNSRQVVGCP